MNATRSLTILPTTWSAGLSIAVVLTAMVLSWIAWKRTGFARSQGLLEASRLLIIVLVAWLFNQPEWVEEYKPEEKPTVAVLRDDTVSMGTRDVLTDDSGDEPMTRRESIAALIQPETWSPLSERMNVVIQSIGSAQPEIRSNLNQPLKETPDKYKNLIGVVLASDGDWNEGPPPVDAATRLRLKGVPVFGVLAGSSSRLPDVELLSFAVPTFGVADKAVLIPFTLQSTLPREFATTVTLTSSDGEPVTKDVRVKPMGRTNDSILWKPPAQGDYTLTLTVPRHPDDKLPDNNELAAPIAIREEKLRVLVVESLPRWEYRYLRNALSRDPGVEVSCLLFHPGLSKVGGGSKDYLKEFPTGLDDLSQYDVVFLGDVGLDDAQLTIEQCRLLKGLVEHQASGLVFMPGWQGRQLSLLSTELADLLPVVLNEAQPRGWGSRTPGRFELTQSGRESLLTKLADTNDDNFEVWENLPGFQWYAPVLRATPGSEVLAVHKNVSNSYGRLPLLVTRTYGAGKVLFMGTDGAWRWRKGVEDKYHYRFWGQVVRWMAYQRNMAKGETMRLFYSPDQPRINQTLALNAHVMEKSGEPLSKGDVSARITAPSGETETVRFTSSGDEWGVFHAGVTVTEPGRHDVVLMCKQTNATLDASFFVQGEDEERVGRPARPEVLEEIARVTRGKVLAPDKIDELLASLGTLPEQPPSIRRVQLWSHPALAGMVVFLLGCFWVGRKAVGLI